MADFKIIPLTTEPNQEFNITIPVDGKNLSLSLSISFNTIYRYWHMKISDVNGTMLLDSVPLLYSGSPADDILGQYEYMNLGSAFVLRLSDIQDSMPSDTNLGTDFVLVWGDTVV